MITFKDRSQIGLDRGIPVIRVCARAKGAYDNDWPNLATTDPEVIAKWDAETPFCNTGFVAKAEPNGVWILETDSSKPAKDYQAASGKTFTSTFTVQSKNGGHRYYKHNEASLAMGNIGQKEAEGFSVRARNAYCLGPLSVHPSGAIYTIYKDVPIVEAEPEMIAWLVSQKKAPAASSSNVLSINGERIPRGQHDNYLTSFSRRLRELGLEEEAIYSACVEKVEKCFDDYGPDYLEMCRKHARNVCRKFPAGDPTGGVRIGGQVVGAELEVKDKEPEFKLASIDDVEVLGMSENVVPDCRLGEIFWDKLGTLFPIDFGWVSLIHAAGVLVPVMPQSVNALSSSDNLTNFYTALVGPTNCGKSSAWTHARIALGIHEGTKNYSLLKAGSAETLVENLQKKQRTGELIDQLFIDVDEMSHLFKKIAIEGSALSQVLTTGFYKRYQTLFMGKGKDVTLNCAMSWIGGIVADEFETCFGSATTGGLYDRFMFGVCPTGYTFAYQEPIGEPVKFETPVPVVIDPSVHEATKAWRKDNPELTREVELGIRFAKVIASFDGRTTLYGKDMEGAPRMFALEQSRIRQLLKPNAGDNPDARFANALIGLLKRKTKPGEWLDYRTIKLYLAATIERLGPNVMDRAINGLIRGEEIEYRQDKSRKNGKKFIRLVCPE